MDKKLCKAGTAPRASRSALRSWGLYLLALTAWVTAVVTLALVSMWFFSSMNWTPSLLYTLLTWIRDFLPLVCVVVVLAGWAVISYYFIAVPARNLELLLSQTEALAHPTETPIRLPDRLRGAEAQLNLVREQALRSVQAARDAEQRKNDLVVYLAHDLKTPLTSVIGYLTLLRDEPQLSPELRARYTGIALDKAERLEDLINEFFDITRFSLTHLELQKQDTDLKRMLQQMMSEFEPLLRQQRLEYRLTLPETLRAVCDPDKMARVLDNLLNNACHYAYPASTISVEGKTDGAWVTITTENAGPTIPPDKLTRMFEQFFRLDTSRGSRTGNAGLGLAIAKKIVEAHGGTITAQSARETITFTIQIPVA